MQRIRTWFRARCPEPEPHQDCLGYANKPPEDDKPEDIPESKSADMPVEKPADNPVCKTANKLGSKNDNPSAKSCRSEISVIPLLDDNDTATSAIAKGLMRLSYVMGRTNEISSCQTCNVTSTIANIVINVINTMAAVPDEQKPRRIHAYHVYATRTGIASYINIRELLNTFGRDLSSALRDAFAAYVYLGMATLVTPAPYSVDLAFVLAGHVRESGVWKTNWTTKKAYSVAGDIINQHVPSFVTCGGITPSKKAPSIPLPDLHHIVSILTSEELASVARGLIHRQRFTQGTGSAILEAADLLESLFAQSRPGSSCPCRTKDLPVCYCTLKPLSQIAYQSCLDVPRRLLVHI
ncbi:hypothetical protein V8F20_007570 [Naviculisporaceae sp. PSN 640]